MAHDDDNINMGDGQAYIIQSYYEVEGVSSGHYQLQGLAFEALGATWDIASLSNPYPVQIPSSSTLGTQISDIWATVESVDGISSQRVHIAGSTGLTVNAIVSDLVISEVGATVFGIGVYGTGSTAVSVTGNIGIGAGEMITISGDTAITGSVYVLGDAGVTGEVGIHGVDGAKAVGVTGQVAIDDSSLIGISGGVSLDGVSLVEVKIPTAITSGVISSNIVSGISLDNYPLSSGVRIQAFDTGISTDYVYVGGGTSDGLSGSGNGYALREFDSIFLEVDNLNLVCVASDNVTSTIRYVGS